MPTSERHPPRPRVVDAEYSYRRPLRLREMLPAIGAAVGAGLLAFYVTRILLQRTPLRVNRAGATEDRNSTRRPRSSERAARR